MNCKKCGFQLTENDKFCMNCGTPVDNTSVQNNESGVENQNSTQMSAVNQPNIQGQNMSQQPMNNYVNPAMPQNNFNQNSNPKPGLSDPKFIIIGVVVLVVIIGIVLAFVFLGNKKSDASETANSNTSASDTTVVNTSNSYYTVKFDGFTFKIPTNLVYVTQTDMLLLGDEDDTWVAGIGVAEVDYSQVLSAKGQLQSSMQSHGYTSSAAEEKTIGGSSYITLETSYNGKNALIVYTKANSMYTFVISIYNINNDYDYEILEEISSILSGAEYTGATNSISTDSMPDMSAAFDIIK